MNIYQWNDQIEQWAEHVVYTRLTCVRNIYSILHISMTAVRIFLSLSKFKKENLQFKEQLNKYI